MIQLINLDLNKFDFVNEEFSINNFSYRLWFALLLFRETSFQQVFEKLISSNIQDWICTSERFLQRESLNNVGLLKLDRNIYYFLYILISLYKLANFTSDNAPQPGHLVVIDEPISPLSCLYNSCK